MHLTPDMWCMIRDYGLTALFIIGLLLVFARLDAGRPN